MTCPYLILVCRVNNPAPINTASSPISNCICTAFFGYNNHDQDEETIRRNDKYIHVTNICMLQIYTCYKFIHVTNIYMLQIYTCYKYIHVTNIKQKEWWF